MFTPGVALDVWVGVGGKGGLMVNLVIASFEVHLSPNTTRCQKLASVVLTLGASTWVAAVCFNFEKLSAIWGLTLSSV